MFGTGFTACLLIIANIAFSYKGFTSEVFFYKYNFQIDQILVFKRYYRTVSSGFLHGGWMHLIFNMLTLYAFGGPLEESIGSIAFLAVYFASLIGGSLLSLYIHRHHSNYTAVGASGAVCGVIFASIALFPGMGVGPLGIPFSIPGWLFGILYVLYSIYGIKSAKDNIGHDAHLGGALVGMVTALLIRPSALQENYITVLIITIPAIVFLYLIIRKPGILLVDYSISLKPKKQYYSLDHKYNDERNRSQQEIDKILDKVREKGLQSLSSRDKETLKKHSRKVR